MKERQKRQVYLFETHPSSRGRGAIASAPSAVGRRRKGERENFVDSAERERVSRFALSPESFNSAARRESHAGRPAGAKPWIRQLGQSLGRSHPLFCGDRPIPGLTKRICSLGVSRYSRGLGNNREGRDVPLFSPGWTHGGGRIMGGDAPERTRRWEGAAGGN